MTDTPRKTGRLLIFAPVPVYGSPEGWFVERQAANGLRLWTEHFDHLTVMMPHIGGPPPTGWIPAEEVGPNLERVKILPLPQAWVLARFARVYRKTRNTIRQEIARADYLSFSIGGLVGDWGAVSCLQAHAMGRRFGVWTDRVESEVVRFESGSGSGSLKSRIKKRVIWRLMAMLEKFVIKRSTIGLFHGQQTYDAYAPYSSNPNIVHDIHVSRDAHISDDAFNTKIASAKSDPLQIVYAGQVKDNKGPLHWASALQVLDAADLPFEAHWLGDGPMLGELRAKLKADGLADHVTLYGFVDDASIVASKLQAAHVFLFCHTTPESPRCLSESLIAGTAIVGFDGSYAADLISKAGGGHLVPIGDTEALGQFLISLATDRNQLMALIRRAREDGAPFDDETVFAHRSELIKQFLGR
jgi:colanic acid/amylovoran biosynthesis glycosyltransferase